MCVCVCVRICLFIACLLSWVIPLFFYLFHCIPSTLSIRCVFPSSVCCDIVYFPSSLSQVAIIAQDGFALLKQVAAAHLGNAAVQEQLCGAVWNLAYNNAENKVRRPDGVARRGDVAQWEVRNGIVFVSQSRLRCMI